MSENNHRDWGDYPVLYLSAEELTPEGWEKRRQTPRAERGLAPSSPLKAPPCPGPVPSSSLSYEKAYEIAEEFVGLLPDKTKDKLARFFKVVNKKYRHHGSGRPLQPQEVSILWAAAYACEPRPKRRFPRPKGEAIERMPWSADMILDVLGILPMDNRWCELDTFIHDVLGERSYITAREIYREALVIVVDRFLRHLLERENKYWEDYEWTVANLHKSINGTRENRHQGEAWRIAREDLISISSGLGAKNFRRAKDAGEELARGEDRREKIAELEADRDALLDHLESVAPEELDALTPDERHEVYKVLGLRVIAMEDGNHEASIAYTGYKKAPDVCNSAVVCAYCL